jgi:nucleoid DNA-binding protein
MQEEHLQYLVLAFRQLDQIELPGIGVFSRKRVPARFDSQLGVLHPPYETFELTPHETGTSFRQFLQVRFQLEEPEADIALNQVTARLLADLQLYRRLELAGFGTLVLNNNNSIEWEPFQAEPEWVQVPPTLAKIHALADPRQFEAHPNETDVQSPADERVRSDSSKDSTVVSANASAQAARQTRPIARRSPVEQAVLVVITVVLLGILVSLFVFRKAIIDALGTGSSQSVDLTETDAELEADLLSGQGFVEVNSLGQTGEPTNGKWEAKPGTLVYHIVVGSETGVQRASLRLNEWQAKGYHTVLVPGEKPNTWRISIFQTTNLNECDRKLAELKLHSLVPYDTWTLKKQY